MNRPSIPCDRRAFLVRAAAVLGTGITAACENSPLSPLLEREAGALALHGAGTVHLFANESGLFADRKPFVVGVLLTDAPDAHATALTDLRGEHDFLTELSYGSTDRYKEDYAEAAMDHFFESDGLRFAAVAVNANRSAGGVDATGLYEELLGRLEGNGAGAVLRMERRFFDPEPDMRLESRLEGSGSVEVEFVPSHASDLLQLGDLLTGSVRGDMARKARGRRNPRRKGGPEAHIKDRLIASLKERLGVQQLVHPSLAKESKFNVQLLHPPF